MLAPGLAPSSPTPSLTPILPCARPPLWLAPGVTARSPRASTIGPTTVIGPRVRPWRRFQRGCGATPSRPGRTEVYHSLDLGVPIVPTLSGTVCVLAECPEEATAHGRVGGGEDLGVDRSLSPSLPSRTPRRSLLLASVSRPTTPGDRLPDSRPCSSLGREPKQSHVLHYKAWHYRSVGLPDGLTPIEGRASIFSPMGTGGKRLKKSRGISASDDLVCCNTSGSGSVIDGSEVDLTGKAVTTATAELIAACASMQRRNEVSKSPAPQGVGRARRKAVEKSRTFHHRRIPVPPAVSSHSSAAALTLSDAGAASGLLAPESSVEVSRLLKARDVLENAEVAAEDAKREADRLRIEALRLWSAGKLQSWFRGFMARSRLHICIAEHIQRGRAEERRIWNALRRPRPVRMIADLQAQAVAAAAARQAAKEKEKRGSQSSSTASKGIRRSKSGLHSRSSSARGGRQPEASPNLQWLEAELTSGLYSSSTEPSDDESDRDEDGIIKLDGMSEAGNSELSVTSLRARLLQESGQVSPTSDDIPSRSPSSPHSRSISPSSLGGKKSPRGASDIPWTYKQVAKFQAERQHAMEIEAKPPAEQMSHKLRRAGAVCFEDSSTPADGEKNSDAAESPAKPPEKPPEKADLPWKCLNCRNVCSAPAKACKYCGRRQKTAMLDNFSRKQRQTIDILREALLLCRKNLCLDIPAGEFEDSCGMRSQPSCGDPSGNQGSSVQFVRDARDWDEILRHPREKYMESCALWHVKPNSHVIAQLDLVKGSEATKWLDKVSYDFANAHLGDRGVLCVLRALAEDSRCNTICFRGCGLSGASAPAVAVFLELHPMLQHADLSHNSFSHEAGEHLLSALLRRLRGWTPSELTGTSVFPEWNQGSLAVDAVLPRLPGVTVDLGGTALAWDRGGLTVGPPCGVMWAGHGVSRTRFAPSGYEKLRGRLDGTQRIVYEGHPHSRSQSPSHSP